MKNELRQISERQHLIKHGFLKSYGKLEMCFICGADANLSFIITSEIARVYLNEFKRKYPCKLWTWFMNCKLITWQNFVDIHIRNSEGGTRLIQHKITGSLHKRIKKLQTDIAKTALEFENYKKLLRLPCGACEHNASTRSISIRDHNSDANARRS